MNKLWRVAAGVAGVLVVLLVLVRWVGSPIVTHAINRKLAALPQYEGHVDAVQLALWRGTVSARNLTLTERAFPGDGPVVKVRHAALSIAWLPLFKGRMGGHGQVEGAEAVMIKRAEPGQDDKKKSDKPVVRGWQDILQQAFPIEITRFEIKDSSVRFEDRTATKPAGIAIDQIHLVVADLANRARSNDELPARVDLTARVGGSGKLTVNTRANAAAPQPRFEVKMELKGLSLLEIHDFLVAYALIDVSAGEFETYSEVSAAGGHYQGYLKPFFKDLQFRAVPDPNKNLMQRAATKVASTIQQALKNDQGNVATKAPFEGDFTDNKVGVWVAIENLLRNAFVQSLREGLEGQTATRG